MDKRNGLKTHHIEFCTNCRTCAQQEGSERGRRIIDDDMYTILDDLHGEDAIVPGSPINFATVRAVMKKFIERLVCFGYWPWAMNAPRIRNTNRNK